MIHYYNQIGFYKILELSQEVLQNWFQSKNLQDNMFEVKRQQVVQQSQILSAQQQQIDDDTLNQQIIDLQTLKQQQQQKIMLAEQQDRIIEQNQVNKVAESYPPEVALQQSYIQRQQKNENYNEPQFQQQKAQQQQQIQQIDDKVQINNQVQIDKSRDDYQVLQQSLQIPVENMTRKENLVEPEPKYIMVKKFERSQVDLGHSKQNNKKDIKQQDDFEENIIENTATLQRTPLIKKQQKQEQNLTLTISNQQKEENSEQNNEKELIQSLQQLKDIKYESQQQHQEDIQIQSVQKTQQSINREELDDLRKEIEMLKEKLQKVEQEKEEIKRSYQQQENQIEEKQNETLIPTPQEPKFDYKLQQKIDKISQDIENYENLQILLQNKQNILNQDQQNQQKLNQQLNEQLVMQQFSQTNNFKYAFNNYTIEKLETQKEKLIEQRKQQHMYLEDLKGNIRVAIRLRPQLDNEKESISILSKDLRITGEQSLSLIYNGSTQEYNFYRVFGPEASQVQVFNELKPLIQSVLDGQNVFIGAIGQTSSGKTYTTIGDTSAQNSTAKIGLMPRAVVELYKQIRQQGINAEIQLAMLELYNDQLIDLINDNINDVNKQQEKLAISKMPNSDFLVKNLTYQSCRSPQALINLLGSGLQRRHIAETKMNINSSRSHTIIYIRVQTNMSTSLLTFADLAGSERLKQSQSSGQRLKEAQHINKSLSALGDVIQALALKKDFVPFRNNKLTMLLQPCMSGNCKSLIICCLCPNVEMLSESYQTLQFAKRGSQVITRED